MSEAAATLPLELPRTLQEVTALQNDLVTQAIAVFEQATITASARMTQQGQTELVMMMRRAADIEGVMLAILDRLNEEVRLETVREIFDRLHQPDLAPAAEPERPRAGHRRARAPRRGHLRPVAAAAAVAAATVAGGTTGYAMNNDASRLPVSATLRPAMLRTAQFPPGSAVLAPSPPPSGLRRAGQDARSASPAPSPVVSAPVVTAAPPQPSPPAPAPVPAGTLVADSTVLDLGVLGAGSVTLTAEGGPVSWSASQVPGLEVWPSSGTLQAGESVTVSFRATDQSQSGFGIVTLAPGVDITISWPAVAGLVQGIASSI
jgi:hypothetical protein